VVAVSFGFNISYSYFQPRGIILSTSIGTKEQIISSSVMVRSALNNQSLSILISNDDAEHWYEVGANSTFNFPSKGNDLVVKIVLDSDGSESPLVEGISVRLIVESFPTNLKVDIGSDGITDWSWNGAFDTIAVLPNFSDILNGYLNTLRNISVNGSVIIPIKFTSDTCGVLNLTDFNIDYDLPPEIVSREPSEPLIQVLENSSILFGINVIDEDGDTLHYHWYIDGTLVGNDSITFNYRPDFDSAGNHTLRVEVFDGHFGLNSTWNITVLNVNRLPIITAFSPVSPVIIPDGASRRFNITAMDPDGDAIGFFWSLDGSERTGNANEFMLKAGNLEPGKHILQVRIHDEIGYTDQVWIVNVKEKIEVGAGPFIYIFFGLLAVFFVLTLCYYYYRRKTAKPGG